MSHLHQHQWSQKQSQKAAEECNKDITATYDLAIAKVAMQ